MRLWHKKLINVLPRNQLLAQWRECCAILNNIYNKGTPNHILVNKILKYNINHFEYYCNLVIKEMKNRNYKISEKLIKENKKKIEELKLREGKYNIKLDENELYKDWHNEKYLRQCYYNLEEKYDCNGIEKEDFKRIEKIVCFE